MSIEKCKPRWPDNAPFVGMIGFFFGPPDINLGWWSPVIGEAVDPSVVEEAKPDGD